MRSAYKRFTSCCSSLYFTMLLTSLSNRIWSLAKDAKARFGHWLHLTKYKVASGQSKCFQIFRSRFKCCSVTRTLQLFLFRTPCMSRLDIFACFTVSSVCAISLFTSLSWNWLCHQSSRQCLQAPGWRRMNHPDGFIQPF